MTLPIDIFQLEANGSVLWRGTAADLEEAKLRIQEFAVRSPGEYMILSRISGTKTIVKAGGGGLAESKSSTA